MGTVVNTLTAVNADIDAAVTILENTFYRTGRYAVTAMYTKFFMKDDASALALTQGTGGTGCSTGSR